MPRPNPFHNTRSLLTLLTTARSTRWPSYSSFTVVLLCISIGFSVAQFAVILALGIKLSQLPNTVKCYQSVPAQGWLLQEAAYPVTFTRMDGSGKFNVGLNTGVFGIIYTSLLTPTAILILLSSLSYMHVRTAGIANRTAVTWGCVAMCLLSLGTLQDAWLGPDLHNSSKKTSHKTCWQTRDAYAALKSARDVRLGLGVGSEVLSGLGALCMALYIVLAVSACRLNNKDDGVAGVRMQDLEAPTPSTHTSQDDVQHSRPRSLASVARGDAAGLPNPFTSPLDARTILTPTSEPAAVRVQYLERADREEAMGREIGGWTPLRGDQFREVFQIGGEDEVETGSKEDGEENEESRQRKDSKNQ